jgi:hypothetical protein
VDVRLYLDANGAALEVDHVSNHENFAEETVGIWAIQHPRNSSRLGNCGDQAMTEPIQAVEVPMPKPKLPRRWVAVCNEISKHGASRTAYAFTSEAEARNASGDAETLYALPASDEAAKPVVSAIPTREEFYACIAESRDWPSSCTYQQDDSWRLTIEEIHALVESRVVVQTPTIVTSIPTVEEMEDVLFQELGHDHLGQHPNLKRGIQATHALVASRVVVQQPVVDCPQCGSRISNVKIIHTTPNPRLDVEYNATPPLDPIKAIVEILEGLFQELYETHERPLETDVRDKLVALKRSLEPGNQ